MRPAKTAALLLLLVPAFAIAKNKKPDVAAIFGTARYVYVEAQDGDLLNPRLYPADRQAVGDVEDAMRAWNRYKVTALRDQAEILIVVRKGRLANGRIAGQVGQPLPPGQGPSQSSGRGPGIGTGIDTSAEVGPEDDLLRVYLLNPDGNRVGPIWDRSLTDGLDAPQLLLVRQLKDAVEKAYPQTAASQPAKP